MDFHSSPAARPELRVFARSPPRDFPIDMPVSAGCGPEQFEKRSFPELPLELVHFVFRQKTPTTRPEFVIFEGPNAHTPEFFNGMTDRLKHPPDLLVSSLM